MKFHAPLSWSDPKKSICLSQSREQKTNSLALPEELNSQDVSRVSAAFLLVLGFRISNLMPWPGVLRFHCDCGFCRLFPAEPSLEMFIARKILLFSNARQMPLA